MRKVISAAIVLTSGAAVQHCSDHMVTGRGWGCNQHCSDHLGVFCVMVTGRGWGCNQHCSDHLGVFCVMVTGRGWGCNQHCIYVVITWVSVLCNGDWKGVGLQSAL